MESITDPSSDVLRVERRFSSSKCAIPCRYCLAILTSLGIAVAYALRVNLSVALVAMVNSTDQASPTKQSQYSLLGGSQKDNEFNWKEGKQGVILSSFFYGYLVTQFPGGWIAARFGGKQLFGLGVLLTAILTLLTPWAAHQGFCALITIRILEGMSEGVTFPAINVLFSSWCPPNEKSVLVTIAYSGTSLGTIFAEFISGLLCTSGFLGGWPSVFYVFGGVGILWYISWLVLVFEKPANHPRISDQEKQYILDSIGSSQDKQAKHHSVPWMAMLKSPAVHALNIAFYSSGFAFYVFLTALPTYFKEVLGLKILEDGAISSIPYLGSFLLSFPVACIADMLIARRICTVTEIRKLATVGGLVIPAFLIIATSYVGKDGAVLAIVLISLTVTMGGVISIGSGINQLDIAPRFAGILMGIGNTFCTLAGICAPLVVGWLTNDEPTRGQWQKVFYIAAGINLFGAAVFVIFGTGEVQPWNNVKDDILEQVDSIDQQTYDSIHTQQPLLGNYSINQQYGGTSIIRPPASGPDEVVA